MISEELAKMLHGHLDTSGSWYLMNNIEKSAGRFSFGKRCRDFTDEQILEVMKKDAPKTVVEFLGALERTIDDEEIKDHLYGYENEEEWHEFREKVERMLKGK